jgi:hypothetical protein
MIVRATRGPWTMGATVGARRTMVTGETTGAVRGDSFFPPFRTPCRRNHRRRVSSPMATPTRRRAPTMTLIDAPAARCLNRTIRNGSRAAVFPAEAAISAWIRSASISATLRSGRGRTFEASGLSPVAAAELMGKVWDMDSEGSGWLWSLGGPCPGADRAPTGNNLWAEPIDVGVSTILLQKWTGSENADFSKSPLFWECQYPEKEV